MGEVYRKIQEVYAGWTQKERDWFFARALSQIGDYDNKVVGGRETNAWRRGAGWAIQYGEANHKKFFCDTLGIDEADYKYMRHMIRLQHFMTSNDDYTYDSVYEMSNNLFRKGDFQSWKKTMEEGIGEQLEDDAYLNLYKKIYDEVSQKGDFSHMMYTISANLIDDGYSVENQWDNKMSPVMSWDNAEQRKDITGWLGDAVYCGLSGRTSFGTDDFIADLDADNIAHLVTEDTSLVDAANEYYNDLCQKGDDYRKQAFIENNPYEEVEKTIMERLSIKDENRDKNVDYKDLEKNRRFRDTYKFLKELAPSSEGQKN